MGRYWKKWNQAEIEAGLRSRELIVREGRIIPNQAWITRQQWKESQEKTSQEWKIFRKKQQAEQEERTWQKEWSRMEKVLEELFKGGKENM